MTLAEYIEALRVIEIMHGGEHQVVDSNDEQLGTPEFHDYDGDRAVVVCEMA